MQFYSITDRGKLRTNNEDSCMAKVIGMYTLLILADGMGGHNGGETASSKAIEVLSELFEEKLTKKLLPGQIVLTIANALEKANDEIYTLSKKDASLVGMGTTAEVCVIFDDTAYIAHIGDSRVYKITADGSISRLTKDHSLVEYMIETGALTPEEAVSYPHKNVITRALGTASYMEADMFHEKLRKNDRLLLCSDGLSNMLKEETIAQVISTAESIEAAAQKLVKLANDAGGNDNITVIIAQI